MILEAGKWPFCRGLVLFVEVNTKKREASVLLKKNNWHYCIRPNFNKVKIIKQSFNKISKKFKKILFVSGFEPKRILKCQMR